MTSVVIKGKRAGSTYVKAVINTKKKRYIKSCRVTVKEKEEDDDDDFEIEMDDPTNGLFLQF